MVGPDEAHAASDTMTAHIEGGDLESLRRDVHRIDARWRQDLRAGDGDAAGAGAEIEDAAYAPGIDPRGEPPLDELRDG